MSVFISHGDGKLPDGALTVRVRMIAVTSGAGPLSIALLHTPKSLFERQY
jgi:hypothetical protein